MRFFLLLSLLWSATNIAWAQNVVHEPVDAEIAFQQQIRHGDSARSVDIGLLYATKHHSEEGHRHAHRHFDAAMRKGMPWGFIGIGFLYERGWSVTQSHQNAEKMYRKAEQLGEKVSYLFLAELKERQANQDLKEVAKLYLKAAQYGFTSGIPKIIAWHQVEPDRLNMTPDEVAFWALVHTYNYKQIAIPIATDFIDQVPEEKVEKLRAKAEEMVNNFNFNKRQWFNE